MIKEIIFDCFGVLLEDAWLAFVARHATKERHDELSDLNHQWDRGIISRESYINSVQSLTGASEKEILNAIAVGHAPNEPLRNYIVKLKQSGYSTGLLSNVGSPIEGILPKNYYTLFDTVTLSYTTGFIKPDPRIFEHHIKRARVLPAQAVFVDDRQSNVDGAVAAGLKGVRYTSVAHLKSELATLGVSQ